MKIYINRQPASGPWGGGNKTLFALIERLRSENHEVVFRLQEGLDIIFCFDPRPNQHGEWYQNFFDYREYYKNTKIIQRVGDLGTHGKPELAELVKQTVNLSDHIIFPSEWAKEYINYKNDNCKIIYNSPLKEFYENRNENVNLTEKIKIITHHWSTNIKKGFKYYKMLDEFTDKETNYEFTYIGRKPEDLNLKNSFIATGDNQFLSETISNSHIYLTASEEEAGANHVLEALACGIPVLYHKNGGSIINYCQDYGVSYDSFDSMLSGLEKIKSNYKLYKNSVLKYSHTIEDSIEEYIQVINNV